MYERFFGLADTPFRLTPDPRYLFLSKRHADALAHLKLGLTESSGFVCITGDVGTGKTTLLRHFLTSLGPHVATAYVFNPALTPVELLQTINAEFGLPATSGSKTELLQALNANLLSQHAQARRPIVVIDEAQALDMEVLEQLRLLSNLETTTEKLLRIILVGQPQLRTILQHPDLAQLNQRITLRWHIGPLGRAESAAYVNHRIDVASGEPGRRLFSRRALRSIHKHAGGVPRLLNMLAHRSLLAAYAANRQRVTARSVRQAHREISTVPLPGAAMVRHAMAPRLGLAFLAGAAVVAGALAGLERWSRGAAVPRDATIATAAPDASEAPAATPASTPTTLPSVAMVAPVSASAVPGAAVPPPLAEGDLAAEAPGGPVGEPPDQAVDESVEAEEALVAAMAADTAHDAMAEILTSWSAAALAEGEVRSTAEYAAAAEVRGLEYAVLNGNASMLRLLDVPAVLELHFPGGGGLRYATLVGIDDGRWIIATDGNRFRVDDAFLERFWYGFAHLVWNDVDRLGPKGLGPGARGPAVVRLQELLGRAGLFGGLASGTFDQETSDAVLAFQRAHFLQPDGLVGPLTRLSLYAAAGAGRRPSLASRPASAAPDASPVPRTMAAELS